MRNWLLFIFALILAYGWIILVTLNLPTLFESLSILYDGKLPVGVALGAYAVMAMIGPAISFFMILTAPRPRTEE